MIALKRDAVDTSWGSDFPAEAVEQWFSRFATRQYFAGRLARRDNQTSFYLVGPRRSPIGMLAVKEREGRLYLGDLYVRARGQGVGSRLLEHGLLCASALGYDCVYADVFENNGTARGLLERSGFGPAEDYREASLGTRVLRLVRRIR